MFISTIAPLGMIPDIIIPCSTARLEFDINVIVWKQTWDFVLNHPSGINLGAMGSSFYDVRMMIGFCLIFKAL